MSIVELAKSSGSTWQPTAPATEAAVATLRQQLCMRLPQDYFEFLRFSNGGAGDLPVQPWYFDSLWPAEEMAQWNIEYQVAEYCPGFVGFGSSGGGEMFAFDLREPSVCPVVILPFIGMEPDVAVKVADDFRSFVAMFGQLEPSA